MLEKITCFSYSLNLYHGGEYETQYVSMSRNGRTLTCNTTGNDQINCQGAYIIAYIPY